MILFREKGSLLELKVMTSATVPSSKKSRIQTFIPPDLLEKFEQMVEEEASDKSKVLEKLLRPMFDPNTIHVEVPPELMDQLSEAAQEGFRSVEDQVRKILVEWSQQ